jgi:DNA-binding LytR/AlgR family response regulator
MTWKCIIVDDEPPAQRVIRQFLKPIDFFEVLATCNSVFEANNVLMRHEIDLIFLDIQMPEMDGISFLKFLNNPPLVIISSAHREYAIEGYQLDVVDYLMKPYSQNRFYQAVNKAVDRLKARKLLQSHNTNIPAETGVEYVFVKEGNSTHKVNVADIILIESVGDYNKIHTSEKVYITYQTLKEINSLLPYALFPRIHKSFVIHMKYLEYITGNSVKIKDKLLPVGKTYRKQFFDIVKTYGY